MLPIALVLASLMVPPTPPPQAAVVQVQARIIHLREVPEQVDQAQAAMGKVEGQLLQDAEDLDRMLGALATEAKALPPLPPSWKVRKADAAEAQFLVGLVDDATYVDLRKEVEATWGAWMAVAQETVGAASPKPVNPSTLLKEAEREALERRLRFTHLSQRFQAEWNRTGVSELEGNGGGRHAAWLREVSQLDARTHTRLKQSVIVRNTLAPRLSAPWKALADHLNRGVDTFAAYEKADAGTASPELKNLRIQAKQRLLERFRSAVFHCHVVWAHMASRPLPKPPVLPD